MRIAFLGENPNFRSALVGTEDAYKRSGLNVGNHAFWNAVDSHIVGEKEYINTWAFDSNFIRDNFDIIVIPASNFLHPDRDLGALASKLEKTQLPLLVIGIGAQSPATGSKIQLKEGTERFISVIKEQAIHITCRGSYTAQVLSDFGVNQISALGCPSNLTNLKDDLGVVIESKLLNVLNSKDCQPSVLLNIDSHRRKFYAEYRKLIELVCKNSFSVVCQNPLELVKAARGVEYDKDCPHMQFQEKLWKGLYQPGQFDQFITDRFITFFGANPWMEYSKKFDLSIGTRLHGNMLAFQSEVPSVFLSHDSRTSELVDIMKLPNCNIKSLEFSSIKEINDKLNFSGIEYDNNRKKIADKYVKAIESAGLIVSTELKGFSHES
jgi:hypothetical protein